MTTLFTGLACFSPSVHPSTRAAWVKNGGLLTHSKEDFRRANYFFCNGPGDSWLNELLSRSLVVRHASWVTNCASEKFLLPIAPYILDDMFDPSRIPPVAQCRNPSKTGSQPKTAVSSLSKNTHKLAPSLLSNAVIKNEKNPPAAHNPLKRSFPHENESYYGNLSRPPKKPRIQIVTPPAHGKEGRLRIRNSSTLKNAPELPIHATKPLRKESSPIAETVQDEDTLVAVDTPKMHHVNHKKQVNLASPVVTKACGPSPRLESTRSIFWKETRNSYCGAGPLVIDIDCIIRPQAPSIQAILFYPKHKYLNKQFLVNR